ncbi:MAG TPA: aminotransferase class V-fold PLP-dependent enzyme, partial [Gammaproteobacteria bacterium]|nr:aminotransferase class V-fold PLP-dependent enzyme [Gammaproteobacteria bacterium]
MNRVERHTPAHGRNLFDVNEVRKDFPVLHQTVNGHPLVYLDNGATSQKPRVMIDTVSHYYETFNANIHRGVHFLSENATREYEASRDTAQ